MLIPGAAKRLDTRAMLPDLDDGERKRLEALKRVAREENAAAADGARERWIEQRVSVVAGPDASKEDCSAARVTLERALDECKLPPEFPLEVKLDGRMVQVTVADVLRDPERYHRAQTRDPIEPDYDGGRLVGMLFLRGRKKVLHSFARGEATYELADGLVPIRIHAGKLSAAVDETIALLRDRPGVFDQGDALVTVADGALRGLDHHGLNQYLGGIVQYLTFRGSASRKGWKACNPPADLSKRILSLGARRRLKPLLGVITAPTMRVDGSILQEPGYDGETQLLLHLPRDAALPSVPEAPDRAEVRRAVETLMRPFREIPFSAAVDRSVMLTALLTACVRWILPTAPAFGFDAPTQGSGKTLLARTVALLATGEDPAVLPHADGRTDEEVRKRLLAVFASGSGALVWDNILGQFDSASLASALTSDTYRDRVLGKSETRTVPTRAMVLLTGNNLTITGDMTRRVLVCRIDPRTEQAARRQFDFDPLTEVRNHRMELIVAGLTVLRGWLTLGDGRSDGRMASFEAWDDRVRQAVAWLGRAGICEGFRDPLEAVDRSLAADTSLEQLGALLEALHAAFGEQTFRAKDVVRMADPRGHYPLSVTKGEAPTTDTALTAADLNDLLQQFGDKVATSVGSCGKVLTYHKDKIVDGLVLRASKDSHRKTSVFRVEQV